ncbi:MAG: STAS domain-containing protein [Mariprofundaceae bacterium]
MKKKVSKRRGAPTALGHDPLAWIDSEENIEEAQVQLDEVLDDAEKAVSAENSAEQEAEEPEEKAAEQDASVAEKETSDEVETASQDEPADESGPQTVLLEESLGIAQVEGFHKTLLSTLNSATEVEIDVVGLQQIDAAGVQLLYAFVLDAGKRDISVSWKSTSEALARSAEQLGLSDQLGL